MPEWLGKSIICLLPDFCPCKRIHVLNVLQSEDWDTGLGIYLKGILEVLWAPPGCLDPGSGFDFLSVRMSPSRLEEARLPIGGWGFTE